MPKTPSPRSSKKTSNNRVKSPLKGLNVSPTPAEKALWKMLRGFIGFALKDSDPDKRDAAKRVERKLKSAMGKAA